MNQKKKTVTMKTKFGPIKVNAEKYVPAPEYVPTQDTVKKAIDALNEESKKRVEKLKAEAKERGARMPADQVLAARNNVKLNAIEQLELRTRQRIDQIRMAAKDTPANDGMGIDDILKLMQDTSNRTEEAWKYMNAIKPDMISGDTTPVSNEPRTAEERVSLSDIPELPLPPDVDPAAIGLKFANDPETGSSQPPQFNPEFTIYDEKSGKDKIYPNIEAALRDYKYPDFKPGIPGHRGETMESSNKCKQTPISQMITELVRNPKTRTYIVRVITGKELTDILKESLGETADIYNDVGYEYLSGVVATGVIVKNYRMFKIWYEGFRFKR